MLPARRRNEVLEEIIAAGGSKPFSNVNMHERYGDDYKTRKYPSSFNGVIQYMLETSNKLKEMAEKHIPRAFPYAEPMVKFNPKFVHSAAERLHARPLTLIHDANAAHEVCSELKQLIAKARSILNIIPKRLETSYLVTEITDQFQNDMQLLDEFRQIIENVQQLLLKGKNPNPTLTLNRKNLEKLKNHITKLGYKAINGETPNILPDGYDRSQQPQGQQPQQPTGPHYENVSDSTIEDLACELSDRLIRTMKEEKKG